MRKLTAEEKKHLWEEVQKEFPDDETMQEVHFVRLMHHQMTKNLIKKIDRSLIVKQLQEVKDVFKRVYENV